MKTFLSYLRLAACGLVVGVANIIPGVSGGTMAVAMGIYDRTIEAISHFTKDVKGNILFLLPLLVGVGAGILAFAKLVEYLLGNHPIPTNFFFIGLVLGSIPFIFKRSVKGKKVKISAVISFVVCLAIMLVMTFVNPPEQSGQAVMTTLTVGNALWLFAAGALAAAAMIIPGISGSFLMLVLGTYATVINAISTLNILILIPVGLGIVVGLLGGAKLISLVMKRYPEASYAGILGLMLGSIAAIYPGFAGGATILFAILALLAGFALTWFFAPKDEA
ncbi:MAG: DUF368 domain-containing protein [Eubacteriales bacterium]|nr:DUF368 domain-containing protein [Eubacteriales bacterium]